MRQVNRIISSPTDPGHLRDPDLRHTLYWPDIAQHEGFLVRELRGEKGGGELISLYTDFILYTLIPGSVSGLATVCVDEFILTNFFSLLNLNWI
jgi:hypothetical protein